MSYEWDERKRQSNIRKHGVDFAIVVEIFEGEHVEIEDGRFPQGERRFLALGQFEGTWYVVASTRRPGARRIISAWKIGRKGKRRYQAIFDRRLARDAR